MDIIQIVEMVHENSQSTEINYLFVPSPSSNNIMSLKNTPESNRLINSQVAVRIFALFEFNSVAHITRDLYKVTSCDTNSLTKSMV